MTIDVDAAREELQRASDAADGEVQRHINSTDEGLMEIAEGDKITEAEADPDRVAELEENSLVSARKPTIKQSSPHIENALDHLDAAAKGFGTS